MSLKPQYNEIGALCLLLLLFPAHLFSQTQDQTKQQAETQLRQMSPEEITRKLKELGMTVEEASQRAQTLGIPLEEYLNRLPSLSPAEAQPPAVDPRLGFQGPVAGRPSRSGKTDSLSLRLAQIKSVKRLELPGFKGRRGIDSLIQPFGYEIFQYPASAFEPSVNVATPPSYALGAGDELVITVWGETRLNYRVTVNRDGNVLITDVGPVAASGLTLQQFRERLLRRMSSIYSGMKEGARNANTFLDVSLAKLKTIQVFVLGEVARPGGVALTSMSTALSALYLAGGATVNGTLRDIRIMRSNDTLRSVDLYRYILAGDKSKDQFIQDGDIVFVKPAGKRAAIVGQVVRPGIYELKSGESLGDLITLAAGLQFNAYVDRIHVERIVPFEQRRIYDKDIIDFDLRYRSLPELLKNRDTIEDGDVVTVYRITEYLQNRVSIAGSVRKPGPFELTAGMKVRDLILSADSLQPNTFSERGTIFRILPNLRKEVIGFNPRLAVEGESQNNIVLKNEDSVIVYAESVFFPVHAVTITGAVRRPGSYQRNESMRVSDLVVMAGGLLENATTQGWEIARLDTTELGVYRKIFKLNVDTRYWEDRSGEQIVLADFDAVFIPADPRYSEQKTVKITGYVLYPGIYTIRYEGERLAELFKRAGGIRKGAYLEGSRLIRKFNNAGLVPLDFRNAIADARSRDNVVVYDGDSIHVAFSEDVVYVSGEVYVPSPVLFKEGARLSYYIEQAGDYKQEAEENKTVVFLPGGKKWEGGDILPGSTIFVPKKIEKEDKTLATISSLATILASLAAITVALIQVKK